MPISKIYDAILMEIKFRRDDKNNNWAHTVGVVQQPHRIGFNIPDMSEDFGNQY